MTLKRVTYFVLVSIIVLTANSLQGQEASANTLNRLHLYSNQNIASSFLPIPIGLLAIAYLVNPEVIYESRKLYLGITKEISVGWGKFGEHRAAFEYSLILSGQIRHFIRFSYKYDFLLNSDIQPSHILQGTPVLSAGGGYFNDFHGGGVFPEVTFGYSIRNHKLLFYPHIKLRHTFMLSKDKPDITDLSAGIIIGIANPFHDVDIRRKY